MQWAFPEPYQTQLAPRPLFSPHLYPVQALRSHIALLLLLCFTRTLMPEAWILTLHAHIHTTVEPTQAPVLGFKSRGKALLSAQHQHCQVEQFYHVPFQLAGPMATPRPRVLPRYAVLAAPAVMRAITGSPQWPLALRGPPRRA